MHKKLAPFLLLSFLLLPIIWPLLQPGFFVTDDGNWMIIRLASFHQTLRSGQFPVRFLENLNHGYGYPVLNFLYPLPFYFAEVLHLSGLSFLNSIKGLFILSFLFSAWGMYLFSKNEWGKQAAIISAVIYSILPYRLFDVYKRGSIGEAVAFIFPPLVFLFLRRFFKQRNFRDLALSSVSLAGLITAHNVVAFLFMPIILFYILIICIQAINKKQAVIYSFIFLILSFSLSAFFWIPAIAELQYTRASLVQVSNFADNFVSRDNFMQIFGILIPSIVLLSMFKALREKNKAILIVLSVTVCFIFFVTPFSATIWNIIPLPRFVQFPWRFLSVIVFFVALLSGYFFSKIKNWLVIGLIVLVLIWYSSSQIKTVPQFHSDSYFETNDDSTTVKNEYMPKWVKQDFTNRPSYKFKEVLTKKEINSDKIFTLTNTQIEASEVYFPGQTVLINGKVVESWPNQNGLVQFSVPKGEHEVKLVFKENWLRLGSNLISLGAILLTLVLIII